MLNSIANDLFSQGNLSASCENNVYVCYKTCSWHTVLTAAIILWRMQRNPPRSFILNGQILQSFNPTVPRCPTPWFRKRQLLHNTHFISRYVFSSSPESIVLSLPSGSQPFHLFRSHLCHTHIAPSLRLIFFIASLSLSSLTLSLHWVIDLSGPHLDLCSALFA